MNDGVYMGPYIALKKLVIPQGAGKIPQSLRVLKGHVFSFDGDELIDIRGLLRAHASGNTISIKVNDGTADSQAHTGGFWQQDPSPVNPMSLYWTPPPSR